jgi:NAD(P) transhydrogenase subunit alpha
LGITIAILKETEKNETRVACVPDTVKKYSGLNINVCIASGAGDQSSYPDQLYKDMGATIAKTNDDAIKNADVVLCVNAPDQPLLSHVRKGTIIIGGLAPHKFDSKPYTENGLTALAMELMPRITRAQNMDILSSQSNLAGYQAVLQAATSFNRAMPMMMTAAGTVAPAKVFVMGVGVAGLQAIATAKRLGAVVTATDVRLATKEQVESLGGKFIMVDDDEAKEAETSGGYAREMSKEYKEKQAALNAKHIEKQDIVITTALIPGRPAPTLVTEEMIKTMKTGSVVVDMAASMGGNCPLTSLDKTITKHGVTIMGHGNLAREVSADTSALFAKNLLNFVTLVLDKDQNKIDLEKDAEIKKAITLVDNGIVIER